MSKKFATLSSLGGGGGRAQSESSDDEQDRQMYVGGSESSGQAVLGPADPNKLVRNVMEAAKEHGAEAPQDSPTASGPFDGAGRRMGDEDDVDGDEADQSMVPITLQMWQNGFSLDGDELRAYDDPSSRAFMQSIMKGSIPAELTSKHPGREIDLRMEDHRGEEYKAPPKKPFSGQGMRLGSIIPGEGTSSPEVVVIETPKPAPAAAKPSGPVTVGGYNSDEATTQVQIRLVNGKRLIAKANTSSLVSTLRSLILREYPEYEMQVFQLHTTYPSAAIEDETVTIKEAGLANAVVMMKIVK